MIGNLTRKPELRFTNTGKEVTSFGIAVNEYRKGQDDYVNFFDCSAFGATAKAVHDYCDKGTKLAIEGKLRYSRYQVRAKIEPRFL